MIISGLTLSAITLFLAGLGFLFFRSMGKYEEWEEEIIDDQAVFIEGLGYVFKDDQKKTGSKLDESELCYLIDRLRDVHTCICKNGEVQRIGRKIDPVTMERNAPSIHLDVQDELPYQVGKKSKLKQVNASKLCDLTPYCH